MLKEEENRVWDDVCSPIAGCKYHCSYCYMHRISPDMTPKFHQRRLYKLKKIKESKRIFLGGAGDAWGQFIPSNWIQSVLDTANELQYIHDLMFITKNPRRYKEFKLPKHAWFGATDDGTRNTRNNAKILKESVDHNRFVCFEPLIKKPKIDLEGISWVIIGADLTEGADRPPIKWAREIINEARKYGIPVWVNDSYGYPEDIKEVPTDFITGGR